MAFTASTTYTDPLPDGPIKYDNVVARIGTAYDPTTGIFTAHAPGIYSISVRLMGLYTDTVYAMECHLSDFTQEEGVLMKSHQIQSTSNCPRETESGYKEPPARNFTFLNLLMSSQKR